MVLTKTPICNFGEKPHSFTLKGVDNKDSKGTIKMHNAKILPRELVGVGQKILGYNDLYHGYMYIDYDDDISETNEENNKIIFYLYNDGEVIKKMTIH